jgi:hypothetical protein
MTLATKIKKLNLSTIFLFACFNTAVNGQVDILKRNLPQKKDANIRYLAKDRTVVLEFPTEKDILKQKSFWFNERQYDRVELMFQMRVQPN